jgi:hypothetical protein
MCTYFQRIASTEIRSYTRVASQPHQPVTRILVDASAGQHRSSPPVTAVPELLHTEEVS